MDKQSFSKIWILIILIVSIVGGLLIWQYFKMPKEEIEEGLKIEKGIAEQTIKDFMKYRTEGNPELFAYLPASIEIIKLSKVAVLTNFSNIILAAPDLEEYEITEIKEITPAKIRISVKSYLVDEKKNRLGYYNEDFDIEEKNNKYLITSMEQSDKFHVVSQDDPCTTVTYPDECYFRLAQERKDAEICKMVKENTMVADCYKEIGILLSDISLCEKASTINKSRGLECYYGIGMKEEKEELCGKQSIDFDSHVQQNRCYFSLAVWGNNSSLCEKIVGWQPPAGAKGSYEVESPFIRSVCDKYFTETQGQTFGKKFIRITQPIANSSIKSPIKVSGWVNPTSMGRYFPPFKYVGDIPPVKHGHAYFQIEDENGEILATDSIEVGEAEFEPTTAYYAGAIWFSPFEADISYSSPTSPKGVIRVFTEQLASEVLPPGVLWKAWQAEHPNESLPTVVTIKTMVEIPITFEK